MHTPAKALAALAEPAPLTLGQVALLDLHKCPLLAGDFDDLNATLFALWLLDMPLERAVAEANYPEKAIVWGTEIGVDGYKTRLVAALNAIAAFRDMLPKVESGDDAKKKTLASGGAETETSRKSSSSSAAPTAGRFATFFRRFLRSRWRCSTAAGCKGREA